MQDLRQLLDDASTPAYAVGAHGVIAYANAALCGWVSLPPGSVVGRHVAYHSEPSPADAAGPLTGLCPPPVAFQQPHAEGTLSVMGQDGRLRHRRARFLSLAGGPAPDARSVIAVLDERDLTPQQLAATLSDEPSEDQLHRDIRRFRRADTDPDATALLLGDSPAARLLRSQFDLARKSTAGAAIIAGCRADAVALARGVHHGAHAAAARLLPIDCARLDEEEATGLLEKHRDQLPTSAVLLIAADDAAPPTQRRLATLLADARPHRMLATLSAGQDRLAPALRPLIATQVLDCPPLAQRVDDLPMIAQFYLERANAGSGGRLGRVAPRALDMLALYEWPQGAAQLGEAIAAAHANCRAADAAATEITAEHLPAFVRHAALAAGLGGDPKVEIDLDGLLRRIESELVERALSQANDNKAEAARLLGLTRQRFYRRLESLGLHGPDNQRGDAPDE